MAKMRESGFLVALRFCATTLRLKTCGRLLVVMKPKRRILPARASSAARCHQYMTKSAESGTSS